MSLSCDKTFTITVPQDADFYGYWKLEEAALPLVDSTGNLNFTSAAGGGVVLSTTGKIGNGLFLANAGNVIGAQTIASNRFSFSGDFTVRFWIYRVAAQDGDSDIIQNDLAGDYSFQADLVNAVPGSEHIDWTVYDASNAAHYVSSAVLSAGWHRLICWYEDGVEIGIKLDNTAAVTTAQAAGMYTPTSPGLKLGSPALTMPNGYIVDEIAIWDRLLTPAEMLYDYNSGAGRTYPEL